MLTTRGTYAIIDFAVRDTRETEHSNVRVAQLDRASGYGPEGREFESSPARHLKESHAVRHAALLSYRITRRFEQDGFDICQNSDLPADGPKVRVRVGRTAVRRANLLRRAT